ncbi:MAG: SpoIIE family protein phosphatase [Pirellulales bacterium]
MSTTLSLRRRLPDATPSRGSDPSRLGRICQPPFAPLLEETEVAGWSSHRDLLAGSFHDWRLLDDGRVLVSVAQVAATLPTDRLSLALAAQAAQTAIRAHALHTEDAGTLLQLAARTLGLGDMDEHVSLAVALVDGIGGEVNLAIAGDCLVWRVRAARWEQLPSDQPPLGVETNFAYAAHEFALSLRERLLLVADNSAHRSPRFAASITAQFSRLDAESHRRMTAADALTIVQTRCEREMAADPQASAPQASASVVAVRRR